MTDDGILLQINVKRTSEPPFYEATIEKYPVNHLELLGMLGIVKLTCEKTINQFSAKKPARYADEDLR